MIFKNSAGGNAGEIVIITAAAHEPFAGNVSAVAGAGGFGGAGAYQLPGKGVTASIDPVSRKVSESHWVGCLVRRKGKLVERHDFGNPGTRTLDFNFSIGSPSSYDGFGKASGTLSVRKGKDGTPLSDELIASLRGANGPEGSATPPKLLYFGKSKFLEAMAEHCSDCSTLKILQEKNNDE